MQKINTNDGLFKNYNKINLTAGTVITAEWLNAVQQELANAIEAFGVSLDSTRSDQLKDIIVGILNGKVDVNNVGAIFPNMTGQTGKFLSTDGTNRFWAFPVVSHLVLTDKGVNTHDQIDQHIASRSNPHNITKEQLDLENVINVRQQPENLTLTALASTSAEADKVPYFNNINSAATTPLTQFARNILDDISAEEVRATLGLGSAATTDFTEYEPAGSVQAHVQAYNHEGLLSENQADAAAGTYGTPSDTNRYVTADDPRLTSGLAPSEHAYTHAASGTDAITPSMIGAEQAGIAQSVISTHESTYNHSQLHSNTNDPTINEKAALSGTSGTPSNINKYVTNEDTRLSDARTPISHNHDTLYEPINTNLTALSGLSPAADKLSYFTGETTAALTTLTSFARNILDDVDAAAVRSTLGLGTIATQAADNVSLTGGSIS
ncbi:MAG: hypothetical protein RBR68_14275, partial [Tenuifilaceae bacterium]|nr:hypothetical protein [Tenuifilaceae bacterium]